MNKSVIHTGDCIEVLADLPAESIHAIVTDPPYGLAFMGNSWDDFEPKEYQEWCEEWATKAKRVLKPGGHMLAFSGTRTYHRLACGIEDAGFEIRDKIDWLYGSGFPKALDVSKAIDKQADAEREKVPNPLADKQTGQYDSDALSGDREPNETIAPEPATDEAEKWDGFKTALKPGHEPVCVARKPFDQTVAENVLEHGTGALNIDGCRIGTEEDLTRPNRAFSSSNDYAYTEEDHGTELKQHGSTEGRYPANVVFDEQAAEGLDEEVGVLECGARDNRGRGDYETDTGWKGSTANTVHEATSGGPSRYFYTSKATKSERTLDGKIDNPHPTVKPTDLMEWLVKLVTAEGQTVVDPFAGSGTTLRACKNLNREFIGIEQNAEYADIARVRVGLTPDDASVVRADDSQNGLEQYT